MAKDLNTVIIIGNVVAKPELSYTNTGTAICKFRLANNDEYTKDNQKVDVAHFFDVEAWGRMGEVIAQYCDKGSRIGVQGKLKQSRWTDEGGAKHQRVSISADTVQFLSGKKDGVADAPTA